MFPVHQVHPICWTCPHQHNIWQDMASQVGPARERKPETDVILATLQSEASTIPFHTVRSWCQETLGPKGQINGTKLHMKMIFIWMIQSVDHLTIICLLDHNVIDEFVVSTDFWTKQHWMFLLYANRRPLTHWANPPTSYSCQETLSGAVLFTSYGNLTSMFASISQSH